jgi:hypothetical protein
MTKIRRSRTQEHIYLILGLYSHWLAGATLISYTHLYPCEECEECGRARASTVQLGLYQQGTDARRRTATSWEVGLAVQKTTTLPRFTVRQIIGHSIEVSARTSPVQHCYGNISLSSRRVLGAISSVASRAPGRISVSYFYLGKHTRLGARSLIEEPGKRNMRTG